MDFRPPVLEIQGILAQIESAQLTHLATAFQDYFIKEGKYKITTHGWHQNDTIERKYKKCCFFSFSASWDSA